MRGGGELASAASRLLFLTGFPVIVLEIAKPLAVRRLVSFAQAVFSGEALVEGVMGRRVDLAAARAALSVRAFLPVVVDGDATSLEGLRPGILVDARMVKRGHSTRRGHAPLVVGLGPGFTAGEDAHAVVETQRGPDLGRVLLHGSAQPDTAVPALVAGVGEDRVLRAPCAGAFVAACRIGDVVAAGDTVGAVDGARVVARCAGLVRGLLADGVGIEAGVKVGDVDPRGLAVDPGRISDKARAVAAGVLEAVLVGRTRMEGGG